MLEPRFPWRGFATHRRIIKAVRPYRTPFAFKILTPAPCRGRNGGSGLGAGGRTARRPRANP
jgi:hypothetical protein